MCQSLLDSESHLHTISSTRDFIKGTSVQQGERQNVKDVNTSNQFIVQLKQVLMILDPLDRLIVKYQSDKVPISEVMPDIHALPNEFKMLLDSHIITQSEFEYLVSIAQSRFLFMYGMAHGLSYILDSRLLGEGLPPDSHRDLETTLFETPINNVTPSSDKAKEIIYMQYKILSSLQPERRPLIYSATKCGRRVANLCCSTGLLMGNRGQRCRS